MTGESPGIPLDDDALSALLDRPFTELTVDELMALKAAYEARGVLIQNSLAMYVIAPFSALGGIYFKTYLETLGQHNAESLIKAVTTRFRKKDRTTELLVGPEDGSAAMLVITPETPDEARLALLDLDVTSEELRGKVLRWDKEAMAWRPDSSQK
jgi:hypothetical protein